MVSVRKRRRSGQSDASSSVVSEEHSNLDPPLISPASSTLSAKKKRSSSLAPSLTSENLQAAILSIYEGLRNYQTESGRLLCEGLMRMPTRRSNPDYYETVTNPIDLTTIQKNIKSNKYHSMEQFTADMQLLVENQKLYHRRSSQEYKDASEFWSLFLAMRNDIETQQLEKQATVRSDDTQNAGGGPSVESSPLRLESVGDAACSKEEVASIITNVLYHLLSSQEEDKRYIAEIFKRVPSMHAYPYYYDVIKQPIDLWMMFKKLKTGKYEKIDQFEEDMTLLINNAKTFNEPSSQVFKDALTIKKLCQSLLYKFHLERPVSDQSLISSIEEFFEDYLTSSDSEADESELNTSGDLKKSVATAGSSCDSDGGPPDAPRVPESRKQQQHQQQQKSSPGRSHESDNDDDDDEDNGVGVSAFWSLWTACTACKNDHGVRMCKQFKFLPNRRQYPDYYVEIKRPISLSQIKSKIRKNRYKDLNHCYEDFQLLFNNCFKYNLPESQIYKEAEYLLNMVTMKKMELDAKGVDPEEVTHQRKKPGRKPGTKIIPLGPDGTPCPELKNDLDLLRKRLRVYYNLIIKHTEPDGRETSELFMQLPSKEQYPLYYEIIKNPIDLKMIDKKIRGNDYDSEDTFMEDVHTMFENARWFNEEKSQIFKDATKLEQLVRDKQASFTPLSKKKINFGMTSIRPDKQTPQNSGYDPRMDFKQEYSSSMHGAPMSPIVAPTLALPSPSMFGGGNSNSCPITPARSEAAAASPAAAGTAETIAFSNPMQRKLFTLYEAVKMKRSPRTGRELYEPFYRLPTRTEFPEYYKVITKPLDMQKIYQKMSSNHYEDLDELVEDFVLVFNNACTFNEPGSRIYKDAVVLMRALIEKKNELSAPSDNANAKVPNVPDAINDILQRITIFTLNREDEDGRCFSDSLYPLKMDRHPLPPLSLDIISRNLDAGVYKRVQHLQEDLFTLLTWTRNTHPPESEVFEDSVEMQLFFMRKRDEMCKNGELLSSPALATNARHIEKEAEEMRRKAAAAADEADLLSPDTEEDDGSALATPPNEDTSVPVIIPDRVVFLMKAEGDESGEGRKRLFLIRKLNADNTMTGRRFFYPEEIQCFPTRKFMHMEVLLSEKVERVSREQVVGPQCHVMHVKDYTRFTVDHLDPDNVFICESMYHPDKQIIKKIKVWSYGTPDSVLVRKREYRINRIDRRPLKSAPDVKVELSSLPSTSLYSQQIRNVELSSPPGEGVPDPNCIYYEQYVVNGKPYRIGDGVLLPGAPPVETPDAPGAAPVIASEPSDPAHQPIADQHFNGMPKIDILNRFGGGGGSAPATGEEQHKAPARNMRRIEKIWADQQGNVWFNGPWFLLPAQTEHEPTRMFMKNELIQCEPRADKSDAAPSPLSSALGTFNLLTPKEYTLCRPTEFSEPDVYICDSRYNPDDKCIGKKNKLKTPAVSKKIHMDEIYYFKKPITILKEPSPYLFRDEIELDDAPVGGGMGAGQLSNSLDSSADLMDDSMQDDDSNVQAMFSSSQNAAGGSRNRGGFSASKSAPLHKKPSGYIAFASVMRPKLKELKPDLEFGELSREVGNQWNELSKEEKDAWDRKAAEQASQQTPRPAEPCAGYENSTPVVVYECCWEGCDFMFEDESDMFAHLVKDESTHINGALLDSGMYKCCWLPCVKNRKAPRTFPNTNRLARHLRESHFKYAARFIYPPQISRHFVARGMLAHFQQSHPSGGPPGWSQSYVSCGIIPTPQPLRSLNRDDAHAVTVMHFTNPNADPPAAATRPPPSHTFQGHMQYHAQQPMDHQGAGQPSAAAAAHMYANQQPFSPHPPASQSMSQQLPLQSQQHPMGMSQQGQPLPPPQQSQQMYQSQQQPTQQQQQLAAGSGAPVPQQQQQQPPPGQVAGTTLNPKSIPPPGPASVPNPYRTGTFEAQVFHQVAGAAAIANTPPPNVFTNDGKPMFTVPPIKREPLTHTKVFLDYIKNLPNKHNSDLKRSLNHQMTSSRAQQPQQPIRESDMLRPGVSVRNVAQALHSLRDYMLRDSVNIANYYHVDCAELGGTEIAVEDM